MGNHNNENSDEKNDIKKIYFLEKNENQNNVSPENINNNQINNNTDYKRRISDVLNLSKTNKKLIEQHNNVKSSHEFSEKKHESFSNTITSPINNNILEKKGVNIDLKYLSSISKKWDFNKDFNLKNSLDYTSNCFVKKKLKFESNKKTH
jgi:hypothetical protein